MKILVVGCGRVGSALAKLYDSEGHEVSVVDELEDAQENLGPEFGGAFFKGQGLDVDLLKQAGIEDAEICISATDGDNTNLVVAQVASKQFEVPCVVVRVFDPYRAKFFSEYGVHAICPVALTVDSIHEVISDYRGGLGR